MSTKLLINEPPLQVLPSLATATSLNEAIVLQQVHYWLSNPKAGKTHGGYKWVYQTYEEWQEQFPFWSKSTIRRAIASLEERGLLISGSFNKQRTDRTKWYRIDYEALSKLDTSSAQDEHMEVSKVDSPGSVQDEQVSTIEKTPPKESVRPRNPLFDAVLEGCYGFAADSDEGRAIAKQHGSIIGKAAAAAKLTNRTPADIKQEVEDWIAWADSPPLPGQLAGKLSQAKQANGGKKAPQFKQVKADK